MFKTGVYLVFIIEVQNLTRSFGDFKALDQVTFSLERGQHYVIEGASGSGKSTLLHLIGGLDRPTQGNISFCNRKLESFTDAELARYRNQHVGFIFQFHFLLPSITAMENILLPAEIAGVPKKSVLEETKILARELNVSHCLNKYPYKLSGGEQQRINVLRAISLRPQLLLCDEPTGNLDSYNSQKVSALLKDLSLSINATLVVVTHNKSVASLSPNKIFMQDGRATLESFSVNQR